MPLHVDDTGVRITGASCLGCLFLLFLMVLGAVTLIAWLIGRVA